MPDQAAAMPGTGGTPAAAMATAPVRALRTWPAVVMVAMMIVARYGPPALEGGMAKYSMISVFGPMLCCLLLAIWWVAASRAAWQERLSGLIGLLAIAIIIVALADPTMRGPGTMFLTLPMGMAAFAIGAWLFGGLSPGIRTPGALLLAAVGFSYSLLLRSEGMTGGYALDTFWRWSTSSEASMLAARVADTRAPDKIPAAVAAPTVPGAADWPGFRGPDRAARALGPEIVSDWTADPPRLLWRIQVGPGWSSFAVVGNALYTQEQRGPLETVACYAADSGREIWNRQIEARLDDPLGGPGPRATPTLADAGLFVTCSTGDFLCLDPATGAIVWRQDLKAVTGRKLPIWGFAASPLVVGGTAIVQAGGPGTGRTGLLGFDAATGVLRWSSADGNESYGSPQLSAIAGENLVLMLTNDGLLLADPATGAVRLDYQWKCGNYRALQPAVIGGDTVLLPTGMGAGTRAIRIAHEGGGLAATEQWTSRNLNPDFTDLVIDHGYAYGNDGGIYTCIDLATGERRWRGGRYGKGQVLLLERSHLLLIAAEDGRVVLVRADPAQYAEVASFKALDGKTWNHPVVVGDRLYIRNAQEAACFQLRLSGTPSHAQVARP